MQIDITILTVFIKAECTYAVTGISISFQYTMSVYAYSTYMYTCLFKHMDRNVPGSTICSVPKLDTIQIPIIVKWLNTLWYIIKTAMKSDELLSQAATWMNFTNINLMEKIKQ